MRIDWNCEMDCLNSNFQDNNAHTPKNIGGTESQQEKFTHKSSITLKQKQIIWRKLYVFC